MKQNSIKVNFGYNLIYQIIAIIVPLITSPYLARTLKAEAIGIYSWSYSVVAYFIMFAALGISNYGNREIAKTRVRKEDLGRKFSSIYGVQLGASMLVILAYRVYMQFFASSYRAILWVQGLCILSQMLDITWYFAGMEDFRSVVIRNSFVKVLNLVAIFLVIRTPDDLWMYTFLSAGLGLASQAVMWPMLLRDVRLNIPKWEEVKPHIKPILILFVPVMAISVFTYMDKLMLGVMSTMDQNGYYENVNKIIGIPKAVITALGTVMMPRTASLIAEGQEEKSRVYIENTMSFTFALGAPLVFGMMAIATMFSILFWGVDFAACGPLIAVMMPSVLFSVYGNVIRTQYLIPRGKDIEYTISLIAGAVVNFCVNFLLIPRYGAMGATVGTLVAEITLTVIQTAYVSRKLPVVGYIIRNSNFLVFAAVMYGCLKLLESMMQCTVGNLIVLILAGGAVYLILAGGYILLSKSQLATYLRGQLMKKGR